MHQHKPNIYLSGFHWRHLLGALPLMARYFPDIALLLAGLLHVCKRRCALLALGCALLLSATPAQAQFAEYEIKAALCYNFAKYVDWPPQSFKKYGPTLVITIYGSDPFGPVIDNVLRGRTVKNKYFEVRRATTLKELKDSHIVFISRSEQGNVRRVLEYIQRYAGGNVLTIGDGIKGFCKMGGMINMLDDFTFELNPKEANKADLIVDNKLMGIASHLIATDETGE